MEDLQKLPSCGATASASSSDVPSSSSPDGDSAAEGATARCPGQGTSARAQWITEPYFQQRKVWPETGRHILAQYDEHSVVVYQAFNPSIAKFATQHQRFGGPDFSFTRMSWIKTNFLWMMYRCGWATKKNQERVLAVRIRREFFEEILDNAYSAQFQKKMGVQTGEIGVRLQWDPDHLPNYDKCQRRAIQLGLKDQMLKRYSENVVSIVDVTHFVREQYEHVQTKDLQKLVIPRERVYVPNPSAAERIGLDSESLTDDFHV